MFVDQAVISIKAGDGGAGAVSFHREKYVAAGGPDGGDGGKGGDVVFVVDDNLSTLLDFRYVRKYAAQNGDPGGRRNCYGKAADDLIVKVPRGTLVREKETGRVLADMSEDEPVILAKGGRGGKGNAHFATATRQIPRFAKPGFPGEGFEVTLELKLLADVGLVGFPNVGKSTLISVVSAAKPKIANYHFTTLTPVLGVVKAGDSKSFVMADIPGLIEGASEGVGLGHEFLRHVERCRMIVHVLDVSGVEGRDPLEDYAAINRELEHFSLELSTRPQIVAGNKCDMADEEQVARVREAIEAEGKMFFPISAATTHGTAELIQAVAARMDTLPPVKRYEPQPLTAEEIAEKEASRHRYTITRRDDAAFEIDAPWLAHILEGVNVDDYESLQYFQRVLRSSGIIAELEERGIQEGDIVAVYDFEFEYVR